MGNPMNCSFRPQSSHLRSPNRLHHGSDVSITHNVELNTIVQTRWELAEFIGIHQLMDICLGQFPSKWRRFTAVTAGREVLFFPLRWMESKGWEISSTCSGIPQNWKFQNALGNGQIRDSRSEIRDSRSEIRDPRFEIRDPRSEIFPRRRWPLSGSISYFCDVFRRCVAFFVAGAALWTCPSSFFVAGAAL